MDDVEIYGLLMTYVDDLFIASTPALMDSIHNKIKATWSVSPPEKIGRDPVKFLGMEISKRWCDRLQRDVWVVTQESYTKDLIQKEEQKLKPKKIPLSRDQALMEPTLEGPTIELVRQAQKAVGEALWLTTSARPDLMYAVSRMGASVTKAPQAVLQAAAQLKGFLLSTPGDGLKFETGAQEEPLLTVYTDASFAPDSQESHGSFIVMLGTTPIFWRSGRQGFVTLSTAESELTEIVEGMIAGEATAVIINELYGQVIKTIKTDSLSAVAILCHDGGSWRTRHLRLRAAYARQAVVAGEWMIQHIPGEVMIADIGTKALTAARLEHLKKLMGMWTSEDERRTGPEAEKFEKERRTGPEAEKIEKERRTGPEAEKIEVLQAADEVRTGQKAGKIEEKLSQAAQVVRLITLAASIAVSKAEEKKEEEEKEQISFEIIVLYTVCVVFLTLMAQQLWNVGVRGAMFVRQCVLVQPRSQLEAAGEREGEEVSQGDHTEDSLTPKPESPVGQSPAHQGRQAVLSRARGASSTSSTLETPLNERDQAQRDQSAGSQTAPTALEMDRMREWDEIEREERLIRDELTRALPGDPILGPVENLPQEELIDLPFNIHTTKYGTVYHQDLRCRYLTAPETGATRTSIWCSECRREANKKRKIPRKGAAFFIGSWGGKAHSDPTCSRAVRASTFACCTACF